MAHPIHVGVGGWNFPPWRETFYPASVKARDELAYASRALTAIEINATFYKRQTPTIYAGWRAATPDGFVFTVKAHRATTMRKTKDDMRESIGSFLATGVTALGDRLGAINWQFPPTRRFDVEHMSAFLSLLPPERDGVRLRHAIEVRHESFADPTFTDLLRAHGCAVVAADDEDWPQADAETADFAYVRLQRSAAEEKSGYPARALTAWAKRLQDWARTRTVFAFFISGAKERNPAAAQALIKRLARASA